MLKPDVRKCLNKIEGTAGGASGISPQLARGGGMLGASVAARSSSVPFADALNAVAADAQRQSCMPGLRTEIGKLQTPEGTKAQEALSALQAEVRAYSQQPAAAAAVAAAASATPDTADRWLSQLNEMLQNMEARQQQLAAEAAAAATANSAGAAGDAAQANDGAEDGADPTDPLLQPPSDEDQAALMEYLRSEVARLQRMRVRLCRPTVYIRNDVILCARGGCNQHRASDVTLLMMPAAHSPRPQTSKPSKQWTPWPPKWRTCMTRRRRVPRQALRRPTRGLRRFWSVSRLPLR